jgi:cbb3-type cytochrome oxidase subunit 3
MILDDASIIAIIEYFNFGTMCLFIILVALIFYCYGYKQGKSVERNAWVMWEENIEAIIEKDRG